MLALLWSVLVFGTLAALAAWAAEQARWLLGASRRLPWLVALVVTVAWPVIQSIAGPLVATSPTVAAIQLPAVLIVSQTAGAVSDSAPRLALSLAILWGAASLVLLARLGFSARAAHAALRTGKPSEIDGAAVVLSDDAGPAVVGWMRSHVLWPRWLSDVDPSLRRLILSHEREHCRSHDPRWLLAAECAAVLMPWHPVVWWMRSRLRAAIELDCDARVLARDEDAPRYGRLLMLLAQRQPVMPLASALAEPRSLLSRRILIMTTPRPQHARLRAAAFSLTAFAFFVTACSSAINNAGTAPAARETPGVAQALTTASPAPTYFEYQVEEPVRQAPGSGSPRYPSEQKAAGVEGEVLTQFIVGTDGLVEPGSFKVLKGTILSADGSKQAVFAPADAYGPFAIAVRDAVPTMRFVPAKRQGVLVRQVVQMPFVFAIAK